VCKSICRLSALLIAIKRVLYTNSLKKVNYFHTFIFNLFLSINVKFIFQETRQKKQDKRAKTKEQRQKIKDQRSKIKDQRSKSKDKRAKINV